MDHDKQAQASTTKQASKQDNVKGDNLCLFCSIKSNRINNEGSFWSTEPKNGSESEEKKS